MNTRVETDSLGEVSVSAAKLCRAQRQRSLEHFRIGSDLIARERIDGYALLDKACASPTTRAASSRASSWH